MTDQATPEMASQTAQILAAHKGRQGALLPILHDVQHAFGQVPEAIIPQIAQELNLTRAEVFGVVSFYHDFRENPAGRHVIKVCRAEACQAAGGVPLAERLEKKLGLAIGETSGDGQVTLDAVYCLGLCSVAPAAMVDGALVGRLDEKRVDAIAKGCKQ